MRKSVLILLAGLLWALPLAGASAHEYKIGDLTIQHPWARASIGAAKAGAAYFVIVNEGTEPDRLIATATPVAKRAQLHTHLIEDGVAKMRPVEAVEVAPGAPTVLQPGGLHVMLMGLTAPLEEGGRFPLTLTFERAGTLEVEVYIDAPTSGTESDDDQQSHDHSS
jgi:hypothetical protein